MQDRRKFDRKVSTYRPACIEIEAVAHVALMRDISEHGAGFDALVDLRIGQPLRYRWGNEAFRSAKVVWTADGRFGVEHDQDCVQNSHPSHFTYRSVRLDNSSEASIYVNGERTSAQLRNFAQRGLGLRLEQGLQPGKMVTLKCGRRFFEGATARWSRFGITGFSLSAPLTIPEMEELAMIA